MHLISYKISNYVLDAGKISLRKPITRHSPREPKLKEAETDEFSYPGTMRQLQYTPRAKLVLKTSTKKSFVQPSVFGHTKASTRSKVILPQWGDIFNRITWEEYPKCIPHSDPDVRALDDQVFPNIRRSYLTMLASRTLVLFFIEFLKWLIDHLNLQKGLISDTSGRCVKFFISKKF
jgi:hypothetical protein